MSLSIVFWELLRQSISPTNTTTKRWVRERLAELWTVKQARPEYFEEQDLTIVPVSSQERTDLSKLDCDNLGFLRNHEIEWQAPYAFWYSGTVTTRWDLVDPQIQAIDFYHRLSEREDL